MKPENKITQLIKYNYKVRYTVAFGIKSKPINDSIMDDFPVKGAPITFTVGTGIS